MLMYMLELYINIDAHPAVGDFFFNIILTMLMAFLHSVHYVDGYVTMLMPKYLRQNSGRSPGELRPPLDSGHISWGSLIPHPGAGNYSIDCILVR